MDRYSLSREISGMGIGDIKYYVEKYEKQMRDKDAHIKRLEEENAMLRTKNDWLRKGTICDIDRLIYQYVVISGNKPTYQAISSLLRENMYENRR